MEIRVSQQFTKSVAKLPRTIQVKIVDRLSLLERDFFDSRLHIKKLSGYTDRYSFRVGREYRVVLRREGDVAVLLLVAGHRKDVYKKLR